MTEQADEPNGDMLVRYFGPTFAEFLILQLFNIALLWWSLIFQQQGRQNNVYDGILFIIVELVIQHMQLINLNFWC